MFCPEGYVLFTEIAGEVTDVAFDWFGDEGAKIFEPIWAEELERLISRGEDDRKNISGIKTTTLWAYRDWKLCTLIAAHGSKFIACAPDGRLMRIDFSVFGNSLDFWGGSFPSELGHQRFLLNTLRDSYFHFDLLHGIIRPCKDAGITEDFNQEHVVQLLAEFEGWAVCWKPKNFENWRTELRALLSEQVDEGTHVKHHSLADESRATATIVGLYDSDDQITKATCREMIGGRLGTLAFERAWAAAVSKRPALSRSGRRKSKPQI